MDKLIDIALEKRIRGFMGEVLRSNDSMLHILKTLPYPVKFEAEDDSFYFHFNFGEGKG
jgi:hypothetical protein